MSTQTLPPVKVQSRPEFAGILKTQDTFAEPGRDDLENRVNGWFDQLIVQSATPLSALSVLLLSLCSALLVGGLVLVFRENLVATALAATVGFLLPFIGLMIARGRRQAAILDQMPEMVDELGRAAKTGRSMEQCLQLVAEDTPTPLGDELRLVSRRLKMGLSMNSAMSDLATRTGVASLGILSTALNVHQQTGGDLTKVLERLSRTIRDRKLFLGRLRAATAASRATAILMLSIPPLVLAFFIFRDPTYFQQLMESNWGKWALMGGVLLEIIGGIWILRILQTSRQT